jgi:hypothetical protein
MTSLKFAEGSAVAFMSSMVSILGATVSTSYQTPAKDEHFNAYLFSHSMHCPVNQVYRIGQ